MDRLRSLRVFSEVVLQGSFAGAARKLDLAPAVVTRAVSDLEDHLGARLLNRTTRKLALTEVGNSYLERANWVLAELDAADAAASAVTRSPTGTVRVLCPPAFATHQLVPQLPDFRARFPKIQLEMQASGPVEGADENFDVSIVSVGHQAVQGDFVIRPLAMATFVLCAAPSYLSRWGHPLEPHDLLAHDGLLPDVSAVRHELTLFRSHAGATAEPNMVRLTLTRKPVIATSQLEVLYSACLAGLGVAGLPSFMLVEALLQGRLERVLPDWHGGALQISAAMPTRKHVPLRTRAFVDFAVDTFGSGSKDPWLLDTTPHSRSL